MSMSDSALTSGEQETTAIDQETSAMEQTSSEASSERSLSAEERRDAIRNLIAGVEVGSGDGEGSLDDAGQQEGSQDGKPVEAGEGGEEQVQQEAEIDTELKDLYSKEVTTRDGEVVTIGALKDAYQDQAATRQEIATRETALTSREASIASDIQALGVLDVMQQVPQPIRAQAAQHMNQMAEREYSKFLALSPDLQNDVNRVAFENEGRAFLGKYGVTPEMFGVRTVGMHRFLADAIKTKKTLADLTRPKAQQAPKSVNRNRNAPKKGNTRSDIVNAARGAGQAEKTAAIRSLIGGQN